MLIIIIIIIDCGGSSFRKASDIHNFFFIQMQLL